MKARIAFLLMLGCSAQAYSGSPPQDEKLLQSLIQRGVICQDLTYEEQQEALRIYLNKKAKKHPDKSPETTASQSCIAPPKQ
ncbi:hypothetical protein [Vibrio rhizosphaerae]|uniref:Uncharacterized protein n=1 Tax=Vibrio rhizosphaerae TaxID=398736 RepID=A0ABU4IZI8_9VIBR|nr:hypothetical protein [Vibrio rhizosphaerae]MDW6094830.1 hypothetical protein [Vibrio rhizosphaerae]